MTENNWEYVEDILFEGTHEEINNLKCPHCDHKIYFDYIKKCNMLKYGCRNCGKEIRANGCCEIPNCSNVV